MAGNFQNEVASDRSRISMNKKHEVRYWTEALGCSEDELAAAVAKVGNSAHAVRREVFRAWAYGGSNRSLPRQKRRHRGDDQEDGPASERKTAGLLPAPALGERRDRSLACRLIAVGRRAARPPWMWRAATTATSNAELDRYRADNSW